MRRNDIDAAQPHQLLERPQLVDGDGDAADIEQIVRARIRHLDAADADVAADAQRQLRLLLERELQIGLEHRRTQLHRQPLGDIAEPGRDVEALERQVRRARNGGVERRRRGAGIEAAAVEREGQPRLDLDLALRRQRADKRHAEVELADAMRRLHRHVGEVGAAMHDDDVVHRETGRPFALIFALRRSEALQHVVDVVVAVGQPRQAHGRRVDVDRVDDRRQAKQRLQRGVDVNALDLELRRRLGRSAGDAQIIERRFECPRVEGDDTD